MAMALESPPSSSSMSNYSHQSSGFSYDVFLSFRGEDTRKTFTDHLYTALNQAGIRTFRDDDAMERGRLLKPELEKAIHESAISLIVFSKEYATSKWCLDEVLMIMEEYDQRSSTNNRREVVPVFYNIEPTDVRNQTGCFEEAFKGYEDEVTRETDVEKKMELLKKVEAWRSCLRKAGSLTGMVLADDGYEAKFISSVVKVIRKKLNYNALYIDEKLVGIAENIAKIESWLQDPSPNEAIFVINGMGGIGKTTIAKCIYNSNFCEYDCSCFLANINDASSHSNGMLRLQSQLLSTILKSDKEEIVWNEYEGTTKITDAIDEWEDAMCKLEANPHPGIQNVLQLSYESLEDENDKNLFLHIACFFVGEDKDYIVKLLAECNLYPIIGIKNLTDRCLLYLEDGKVGMHQLIREMGQEVVRLESPKDPGKRSRLWRCEDCVNVLQENVGTKNVEGFRLHMQNFRDAKLLSSMKMENPRKRSFEEHVGKSMSKNETNFKIRSLEKMKNLMLLQLSYVTFSGKYKKLPKKLRLLSWHGFSLKSIPGDIPLEKLVVLDMSYSKLERVWDDFKFIESLKILNLSYSVELIKTPNFGGLPSLVNLILKGCTSLTKVDESIAYLDGLVLLDLTDCRSLRNVPCLPRSLVSLQMSGCPNLGAIRHFECSSSTSLPSLLVKLNISYCNLFDTSFPNDWSNLVSLKVLRIDGNNVTYLPKCIQSLPRLNLLCAARCSQLQSIQGLPKTLTELDIERNMSLEKVEVPLEKQGILVTGQGCPNLCYMEGNLKWQSIDKVERKIIQKLLLGMEMDLDYSNKQKVVFEYGIFSARVREEHIPSSYTYKERGPQISFKVPSHDTRRIISGFNLSLVFSPLYLKWFYLRIEVYNMNKDLLWIYFPGYFGRVGREEKEVGWISVWRCGNLLHDGDQIFVRILYHNHNEEEEVCREVEECCINLIYDDDDELDNAEGKRKVEGNDDETMIRWSDRMFIDISDYVHPGKTYSFGNNRDVDYDTGFYYGSYRTGRIDREILEESILRRPVNLYVC